jgi:hypothetical protein
MSAASTCFSAICYNLTCLIQEQETLGIVPVFWKGRANWRTADSAAAGSPIE